MSNGDFPAPLDGFTAFNLNLELGDSDSTTMRSKLIQYSNSVVTYLSYKDVHRAALVFVRQEELESVVRFLECIREK